MPIFALLLALEISVASLLVNLPNKSPSTSGKVLGKTMLLAQDTPPDNTTSTDTSPSTAPPETTNPTPEPSLPPTDITPAPTDQTPPQPADANPTPATSEPNAPTEATPQTTAPTDATTPTPETPASSPASQQSSPTTAPENTNTVLASPEGTSNQNPQLSEQPAATATPPGILATDENTTNPERVDPQSVAEAQQEEQQLEAIQDPNDKADALTHFASDKITDIDRFTQTENFSSTTFANARLLDQIDQLVTLTKSTPTEKTQQQLTDLCQQATTVLRTAEEAVPEEMEQDLEITRSKCLNP